MREHKGVRNALTMALRARRRGRRGVSPIIATILLVAITVVLAAVLYVLISGLTSSTATAPISLAPTVFTTGTGGSGSTWYVAVGLNPTAQISTSQFGLKVTTTSTTYPIAAAAAPAGCTATGTPAYVAGTTCTGVAGDWYAVLTNAAGNIVSVYTGSWSVAVTISGGSYSLSIISAVVLDGQGYKLAGYGTGSASVSGQVNL